MGVLLILMLIFCVTIIFQISKLGDPLPSYGDCSNLEYSEHSWSHHNDLRKAKKLYMQGSNEYFCWCSSQNYLKLIGKNSLATYCNDFTEIYLTNYVFRITASIVLVILNMILKTVSPRMSIFEKY